MAAYLALAAQCPGFGAARYDVLELSTVRGRREKGTLVAQAPHLCPRARGPTVGHFTPYTQHSCPFHTPGVTDWLLGPHISGALAPSTHELWIIDETGNFLLTALSSHQNKAAASPFLHSDSASLSAGAWWGCSTEAMPGPGSQGHVPLPTG